MLALLMGASLACLLGLTEPPTEGTHTTLGQQALDFVRIALATCLAVTLVMGPGIAVRVLSGRSIRLAFLPFFGFGVMIFAGCLAWCLHGVLATETTCLVVVALRVVGDAVTLSEGAAGPHDDAGHLFRLAVGPIERGRTGLARVSTHPQR